MLDYSRRSYQFYKVMRALFSLLIVLQLNFANSKGQTLKWADIYDCDFSKGAVNPDEEIDCELFFQLKDSFTIKALIIRNWTSFPGICNLDSVLSLISYPKEAEQLNITGTIRIRFLIDKGGNVYCYQLLSELDERFRIEAVRLIKLIRFNGATIDNKPVAYVYSLPLTFKPDRKVKKKK